MAVGSKTGVGGCLKLRRSISDAHSGLGLGFVSYTAGLGRKRIVISSNEEVLDPNFSPRTPLKRQCSERMIRNSDTSLLEALPQEILIRVLCGVNHDDLKQLFHVSTTIREATLVAKQCHFAYSTPSKVPAFRTTIDLEDSCGSDEINPLNAPKRKHKSRLNMKKKLSDISSVLFA